MRMNRLMCLVLLLPSVAFGQALSYIPPQVALFFSSDGSGSSGTWDPLTGSGGSGPLSYVPPTMGMYYSNDGTGNAGTWVPCTSSCGGSGGGSGTVTSFSAGNLSPLFTTSVATATTTPALTFTASTAAQNAVLAGPATGGTGAYSFRALVSADIPNNAANTSGTAANLSGTPALPNGVTATTQTAGDNSTKLATTAYTNITPTTVSTSGSPLTLTGVSGVYVNNSGGAFNWVVDVPVLGKTYCFTNYPGQTGVLTITSTTSVFIAYGGTNGTVTTGTLVSGGAKGDALCIEGLDSTHYSAFGAGFGVWINH